MSFHLSVESKLVLAVVALGWSPSASAAIFFDGLLNNTRQIRTAANNPVFGAASTQNLAGVNFFYEPGGIAGGNIAPGASVNGVFFDNVNLAGGLVPPGPHPVIANGVAASLTLDLPWSQTNEDNARTQSIGAAGTDSATLNTLAAEMFYLSTVAVFPPFNHLEATTTFAGLGANRNLYVQLIGGDTGHPVFIWNGDIAVTANGSSIGTWNSVSDNNPNTGSLYAFDTATNAAGELVLDFQAVNGNYAAISGIIILGQVPEPTALAVWGLGSVGAIFMARRNRRARPKS